MAFKVRIAPRVVAQIRGWHLPDEILIEVNLYLREVLPADLVHNLNREGEPFDHSLGMTCCFSRRDHQVSGREHHFIFHVFFSQDEETLGIERVRTSKRIPGEEPGSASFPFLPFSYS